MNVFRSDNQTLSFHNIVTNITHPPLNAVKLITAEKTFALKFKKKFRPL